MKAKPQTYITLGIIRQRPHANTKNRMVAVTNAPIAFEIFD